MDKHGRRDETEIVSPQAVRAAERQARIDAAFPVFSKWYRGWQSLYDNPFAQYLLLAERRQREQRRGKHWGWRRGLTYGVAASVALYLCWRYIVQTLFSANQLTPVEQAAWIAGALFLGPFLTSYVDGIYGTARFCLSILNCSTPPGKYEYASELLRASQQSDYEILIGLLRLVMPRLMQRVAAAVLVAHGAMLFIIYERSGMPYVQHANTAVVDADELARAVQMWQQGLRDTVVYFPATCALALACGALAALAWAAWLIMLGRRRASSVRITVEAGVAAAVQTIGLCYGSVSLIAGTNYYYNITDSFDLSLLIAGGLLCLLVALHCLAARASALRAVLPLGLPALHGGLMLLMLIVAGATRYRVLGDPATVSIVVLHDSLSAFLLAVPQALGRFGVEWQDVNKAEELYPVLFQLALVPLLLWLARDSVRRYRQAVE
jgi:hypothetical protein